MKLNTLAIVGILCFTNSFASAFSFSFRSKKSVNGVDVSAVKTEDPAEYDSRVYATTMCSMSSIATTKLVDKYNLSALTLEWKKNPLTKEQVAALPDQGLVEFHDCFVVKYEKSLAYKKAQTNK